MYAAPPEFDAQIFTRMPKRFHRSGVSEWAKHNKHGAELHSFLEGPCFDSRGNLYVVDIPWGRIFRIDPEGQWTLAMEYDGWPNGLKFDESGRLLVADYKKGLLRIDLQSETFEVLVDHWRTERLKGPNDLFLTPDGSVWFTDQGQTSVTDPSGRVFCLSPTGVLTCLSDRVPSPNGIVVNSTGTAVLVATRENAIWSLPVHADMTSTKGRTFIQLSGGGGPDGMAWMPDGSLAVCHAGLGSVWVFSAWGEPISRIRSPAGRSTTNLTVSLDGSVTLYITESETASILRFKTSLRNALEDASSESVHDR